MFLLNGVTLPIDACFTDLATGIQYPANWLRLASPEERAAIGITEAPDPVWWYDQRFYWSPELPKDHSQLVEQWIGQTRTTANTLLAPTDWMVIREADNGKAMDAAIKAERQRIREVAGIKVAAINATAITTELAAYITSAAYSSWSAPESEPEAGAPVVFSSNTTTTAFGG
jgi:hypothetical protein